MSIEHSQIRRSFLQPAADKGFQLDLKGIARRSLKKLAWVAYDLLLPLGGVAIFFWLQVQIDQSMSGLASQLVLLMTVLVEFGLIMVWNSLRDYVHHICHR